MSFSPVNDDHAVQSVAFSVLFDRPLDQRTIGHVQGQHERWRADLPAINLPQIFGFEINPGGGSPKQLNGNGVEFSYLRPDGTPAWQLRFEGPSIIIECTRYTRWDRIWQFARSHIQKALAVVDEAGIETEAKIVAASLQYVDKFISSEAECDFTNLFSENDYLPRKIPSFGNVWHTHLGWFDHSLEFAPVLNNLNIDAKIEPAATGQAPVISILHLQQARYKDQRGIGEFRASLEQAFDELMNSLHIGNKELIGTLLGEEMKAKIGLAVSDEGQG